MASESNAPAIVNGIKTTAVAIIALSAVCLQTGLREQEKNDRHSNIAYLEKLITISNLLQSNATDLTEFSPATIQGVIDDTAPSVRQSPIFTGLAAGMAFNNLRQMVSRTPRSTFATTADPLGVCQPIIVTGAADAAIPVLRLEEIPGSLPVFKSSPVKWGSAYLVSFHAVCLNVAILEPQPFLLFVNFPAANHVAIYAPQNALKFIGLDSLFRLPMRMGNDPIVTNFVPIDYAVLKSAALDALGRINGKFYESTKLNDAIRDALAPAKNDFSVLGIQIDSQLFSTIVPLAFLSFWIIQVMNFGALSLDVATFSAEKLNASEPWPLIGSRGWPELMLIGLVGPILVLSPIMVAFALFEVERPVMLQILQLLTNLKSWNGPYLSTIVRNPGLYIVIYNCLAMAIATYCCVYSTTVFVALRREPARKPPKRRRKNLVAPDLS